MPHIKLFIPGPIEVSPKTLAASAQPMIGHRSGDFKKLYAAIQPQLQALFYTKQPVFISTSSSWGLMEGAIRNVVAKKVLNCMNGAFSDKWLDVSRRCGKQADGLQSEWGQPVSPEALDAKLATGEYDAVTIIHNETSTGVMSNIRELAAVLKKYPDVISIVDTVSSFSVVPIPMDELGIDVMLTGSQKALALPPGLSLLACSERAFARAATIEGRGYYFDFLEFKKNGEGNMTPSTPCISLIYALQSKLAEIFTEGLEARYVRHAKTNQIVADWVIRNGFEFFAEEGYRSEGLTCISNNKGLDMEAINARLKQRYHAMFNCGYGKIKGKTFRISNMGDETEATMTELLGWLDDCIKG